MKPRLEKYPANGNGRAERLFHESLTPVIEEEEAYQGLMEKHDYSIDGPGEGKLDADRNTKRPSRTTLASPSTCGTRKRERSGVFRGRTHSTGLRCPQEGNVEALESEANPGIL